MLKIPKGKKISRSHSHAPKQEKKMAHRLGADVVRRSGAGDVKGDVRKKRVFRLECKCTKNLSFSIDMSMIQKIEDAALASGELPAIQVEFINDQGRVVRTVAVVPTYVLDELATVR